MKNNCIALVSNQIKTNQQPYFGGSLSLSEIVQEKLVFIQRHAPTNGALGPRILNFDERVLKSRSPHSGRANRCISYTSVYRLNERLLLW